MKSSLISEEDNYFFKFPRKFKDGDKNYTQSQIWNIKKDLLLGIPFSDIMAKHMISYAKTSYIFNLCFKTDGADNITPKDLTRECILGSKKIPYFRNEMEILEDLANDYRWEELTEAEKDFYENYNKLENE